MPFGVPTNHSNGAGVSTKESRYKLATGVVAVVGTVLQNDLDLTVATNNLEGDENSGLYILVATGANSNKPGKRLVIAKTAGTGPQTIVALDAGEADALVSENVSVGDPLCADESNPGKLRVADTAGDKICAKAAEDISANDAGRVHFDGLYGWGTICS